MRRSIQMVTVAVLLGLPLFSAVQAADVEEITARCEAEAKDNEITDPDAFRDYVQECVEDLSAGQGGSESGN